MKKNPKYLKIQCMETTHRKCYSTTKNTTIHTCVLNLIYYTEIRYISSERFPLLKCFHNIKTIFKKVL